MEEVMTIIYSKRSGDVFAYSGSENDMSMYGELEEDYSLIYDYIVVELDNFVMENFQDFKVVDGKLKYKFIEVPDKYL